MNQFCLIVFSYFLLICPFMPVIASTISTKEHLIARYVNEEKKFSIEYPSRWIRIPVETLDMPKHGFCLAIWAPFKHDSNDSILTANMIVNSENVEDSVTLEQVFSEIILLPKKAEDLEIESGEINLNGIPCKWIHYKLERETYKYEVFTYLIVAQNMKYEIIFGTDGFTEYCTEFEKIISSFCLL